MGEAGLGTEDDRVELIEGELIAVSPIGGGHAAAGNFLARLPVMAVGGHGIVPGRQPRQAAPPRQPTPSSNRDISPASSARRGVPEVRIVDVGPPETGVRRAPVGGTDRSISQAGAAKPLTIAALANVRIR